jgi:hypothetical protein
MPDGARGVDEVHADVVDVGGGVTEDDGVGTARAIDGDDGVVTTRLTGSPWRREQPFVQRARGLAIITARH